MKKVIGFIGVVSVLLTMPLVASAAVLNTTLVLGTLTPDIGSSTTVIGTCGNSGANNYVTFALIQNNATTTLPNTNNLSTGVNGDFSGSINFPVTATTGSGTLVVTCNGSGDVILSSPLTFVTPTTAATSTMFSLGTWVPTSGGVLKATGTCSLSTGTAQLDAIQNSATTTLGSFSVLNNGEFSGFVFVPGTISSGNANLVLTCPNDVTYSTSTEFRKSSVENAVIGANPTLGSTGTVSGSCVGSANASGTVGFGLLDNMALTNLEADNALSDINGSFISTVKYPTIYQQGTVSFVITCPDGTSYVAPINLLASSGGVANSGLLTLPPEFGGMATNPTGTTQVPVGGVKAGAEPTLNGNTLFALALVVLGSAGMAYLLRRKQA